MQPHSEPDPIGQLSAPRRCELWRRLLAMLYDALVVIVLMMVATAIAMLLQSGNRIAGKDILFTLYLVGVWFLYLAWCWRRGGMTLGMLAWRVRLVTDAEHPMSWWHCVVRFGGGLVSALPLGLGYLWSLLDHDGLAWHDRLSQSRLERF